MRVYRGKSPDREWRMDLNLELLQFYRCKDLDQLLHRCSVVFDTVGFPFLVLKWAPSPASDAAMRANSQTVWSNLEDRIGENGTELMLALADSIQVGLTNYGTNTRERQGWQYQQVCTFRVANDAPKEFFLTAYQQSLICDFGEPAWTDFIAFPLSKERDRILLLEAKTQIAITSEMQDLANKIFPVFQTVFRSLHGSVFAVPDGDQMSAPNRALSEKELECLRWLAAGKTLSEAALILGITERTLRYHIKNARERLGVSTTMQAVVAAAMSYGFDPNDARKSLYAACRPPALATR